MSFCNMSGLGDVRAVIRERFYNTVNSNLWNIMREFEMPNKINLTRIRMEDTQDIVMYEGRKLEPFYIRTGLK